MLPVPDRSHGIGRPERSYGNHGADGTDGTDGTDRGDWTVG